MLFLPLLASLTMLGGIVSADPIAKRAAINPTVDPTEIILSPTGGGTYPRLTYVGDTILAGYTVASGGTKTLTISRSTDGGASFQALGTVAESSGDLDNINLITLPNGNVIATFRNHDLNSAGDYTYYRITACVSTDGGATWTFLSQVNERAATATNNGLWEPFNRIAVSGDLQVYYASENSATDQDILMQYSTDSGSTWSSPITVSGGTTTGRDGMPGCAEFSAGSTSVMCVFETTEGTGTFTVKSVVSTDDGMTFGDRAQVYIPTGTDNNAGAPQITLSEGGAWVVSFMTDEDTSEHDWVNGADMKIVTSQATNPASWGQKTTVSGVQSNWPGLLSLTSGVVYGCADYNGVECHSISLS